MHANPESTNSSIYSIILFWNIRLAIQCYHQKKQKRNEMIFEVILQLLNDVSTLSLHQKCQKIVFLMTPLQNKTYVKKKINFLHANPESINSFILKKRMKKCFKIRNIRLAMQCYHKIKKQKRRRWFSKSFYNSWTALVHLIYTKILYFLWRHQAYVYAL